MKKNIEIVTGFIGSGKTTFINELLDLTLVSREKVLIVQCENGTSNIKESLRNNKNITIKKFNNKNKLNSNKFNYLLSLYNPHRVIIEHNGSKKLEEFFKIYEDKKIYSSCKIGTIYHIAEAMTFNILLRNTEDILYDQLYNSDMLVLTNTGNLSTEALDKILCNAKNINDMAEIIDIINIKHMSNTLREANILDNGIIKKFKIYMSYKELNMMKKISSRI